MRMLVCPQKPILGKRKRLRIAGCLICCGSSIDAEADSVKMLAICKSGSDLAGVVESPEKSTVFLIPHDVLEECDALMNNGDELVFQFGIAKHHLRGYPGHSSLEDGKLAVTRGPMPFACEVGMESTVLAIDGTREPNI